MTSNIHPVSQELVDGPVVFVPLVRSRRVRNPFADAKREIVARLASGPQWSRSFQAVKPLVEELIRNGVVERCKPDGGRANNMIRLAQNGREIDRFAEALSETGTIIAASRIIGVSYEHGKNLHRQVCASLGWQAV